jgi:hypothetical protein
LCRRSSGRHHVPVGVQPVGSASTNVPILIRPIRNSAPLVLVAVADRD